MVHAHFPLCSRFGYERVLRIKLVLNKISAYRSLPKDSETDFLRLRLRRIYHQIISYTVWCCLGIYVQSPTPKPTPILILLLFSKTRRSITQPPATQSLTSTLSFVPVCIPTKIPDMPGAECIYALPVTYEIVMGRAKPGHTRGRAKRSSGTMGIKAGNQDRLRDNQH